MAETTGMGGSEMNVGRRSNHESLNSGGKLIWRNSSEECVAPLDAGSSIRQEDGPPWRDVPYRLCHDQVLARDAWQSLGVLRLYFGDRKSTRLNSSHEW